MHFGAYLHYMHGQTVIKKSIYPEHMSYLDPITKKCHSWKKLQCPLVNVLTLASTMC